MLYRSNHTGVLRGSSEIWGRWGPRPLESWRVYTHWKYVHTPYVQCCCQNLFLGLETKTETWVFRSRDRDRDLDKMNSSALESRDYHFEITSLAASIQIGDRTLA